MESPAASRIGIFEQLEAFESTPVAARLVWPLALAAAWVFDFLFWSKTPGISFPLFVVVLLIAGYVVVRANSVPIAASTKWLLIPLAVFSVGAAVRAEPLTLALDFLATVLVLGVVVDGLSKGRWMRYRTIDFIVAFIHLGIAGLIRGGVDIAERRARRPAQASPRRSDPVVRGILLSLPLILLFGLLMASADLVFSRFVTRPFRSLDSNLIQEYAFRLAYVLGLAYLFGGLVLHAMRSTNAGDDETLEADAAGRRGLGMVEGSVVLGSLTALFTFFVVIQFRYFFAGSRAITNLGMTYSEYARKGFGELVAVAVLVLALLVGLSVVVRMGSKKEGRIFSSLSSALVLLTAIILVSAFQRLLLYEDVFGFTRLRTYSHVFMVWLGLTLVAALVLQWRNSLRSMTLVLLLAGLGYAATLNVMAVDAFIARSNIDRAVGGAELDVWYLDQLSSDAVPAMVTKVDELPEESGAQLSNLLVCKALDAGKKNEPWQSLHLSRERVRRALADYYQDLSRRDREPICGPLPIAREQGFLPPLLEIDEGKPPNQAPAPSPNRR